MLEPRTTSCVLRSTSVEGLVPMFVMSTLGLQEARFCVEQRWASLRWESSHYALQTGPELVRVAYLLT